MDDTTASLTGIWQGLYSYPRMLNPVSFLATLIDSRSRLSGSTHEPHRETGAVLCATLLGRRAGRAIQFVKTYNSDSGGYGVDVHYEGTLAADGTEIEGRWIIRADWSGRFLMIRGSREAETVARRSSRARNRRCDGIGSEIYLQRGGVNVKFSGSRSFHRHLGASLLPSKPLHENRRAGPQARAERQRETCSVRCKQQSADRLSRDRISPGCAAPQTSSDHPR